MTNIYLATSWRNDLQPQVVDVLRAHGHDVYDFRNPNGGKGFAWSDRHFCTNECDVDAHIAWDPNCSDPRVYMQVLEMEYAKAGYLRDMEALQECDVVVLLLPCERDAHLELGWAAGAGKETVIYLDNPCKASLMYSMVDKIVDNMADLLDWLT